VSGWKLFCPNKKRFCGDRKTFFVNINLFTIFVASSQKEEFSQLINNKPFKTKTNNEDRL
jgi:hypothetical protein